MQSFRTSYQLDLNGAAKTFGYKGQFNESSEIPMTTRFRLLSIRQAMALGMM